jgi:carbon starvation protein CstA
MGILFGPIAFILIPVGCILGGCVHDYFTGMMAMRNSGAQMPLMVKKYTNNAVFQFYNLFISFLLLLVGAVFIYVPGDLILTQVFGWSAAVNDPKTWLVYGGIFAYYLAVTYYPIDAIMGRLYPPLGLILLFSALGVFGGILYHGYYLHDYTLVELSAANWMGNHPDKIPLLPIFFVTVACGIVSGFHSSQTTLFSRGVTHERQGRMTFFNAMAAEGFIAMVWAGAAMGLAAKLGADAPVKNATAMVGAVCRDMLGTHAGMIAIIGVILFPITTGDSACRSLRLIIGEYFNIDQKPGQNRLMISTVIFAVIAAILYIAKADPDGFNILWRYFAWGNQTLAVFAFAIIAIYLAGRGYTHAPLIALLPGAWYVFITISFICNAAIGLNLSYNLSMIIGVVTALVYAALVWKQGIKVRESKMQIEDAPVYS